MCQRARCRRRRQWGPQWRQWNADLLHQRASPLRRLRHRHAVAGCTSRRRASHVRADLTRTRGHDPDVPGRERAHPGAMSSHTRHPYTRSRSVMSSTTMAPQIRLNRVTPSHCRVVLDNPPLNLMGPEFVLQIRDIVTELALACDMSFASREKALFSQWEVGIGLVAGGGPMARLPRVMGRGRALEVL